MHSTTFFDKTIWLSSPTMHGDELKYMTQAYEQNWMSTVGENIDEVERIVSEQIGRKHSVGLNSCTSALHLAIKLAGVNAGDKVFCSDLTFVATANPIVYEGATPIFIDSEYETWNMDPFALEKAFELYSEVKVVVVANLFGVPAKLEEIKNICDKHNAILIEDAAESLGATYKGRQTGSFGKYSAISFNGNKIITGSSGGILLTDGRESAQQAKKWSQQSYEDVPWYEHKELGYNYRMSNVVAGVIRGQFSYLQEHIARKKAIYEKYKEAFNDLPINMNPFIEEKEEPNYWLSCIMIDKNAMCEQVWSEDETWFRKAKRGTSCPLEIFQALSNSNIQSRPIWKPMHLQPIYYNNELVTVNEKDNMEKSVSFDIFSRSICLPSDIKMTTQEQEVVIEIIRDCFQNN